MKVGENKRKIKVSEDEIKELILENYFETYLGGYTGLNQEKELKAFHHGMRTGFDIKNDEFKKKVQELKEKLEDKSMDIVEVRKSGWHMDDYFILKNDILKLLEGVE